MKTYQGVVHGGWPGSVSVTENGRTTPLRHIVRHSPDGFAWGYGGSGPADLALAILTDVMGSQPTPAIYQQFKVDVVSGWPQDQNWTLSEATVRQWLRLHGIEVGEPVDD